MEHLKPIKSININNSGGNCGIRFGDLSGDGRMDFLFIKPDAVSDERYFAHKIVCATAYSPDGELLWQIGDVKYESPNVKCDLPAQIYDIDRDGKNEVILIMNDELLILDGKSGKVKKSTPLPDSSACDSITIADLEGTGYAQNIIIKNKYSKLWVLDFNLNVLWSFEDNLGHTPFVFDINGDGKEEIIAGYCVLSSDGELLWKAEMPAHANSVCACVFSGDSEPTVIFCGPSVRAYKANGELLWEIEDEAKSVSVSKFRNNSDAEDILLLDSLALYSAKGEFLMQKNETVYLPTVLYGFDNSDNAYIAGHKKEDIVTTLYDGYMRPVYTLETFGNIAACDILGDGRTQIIIYSNDTADIYSPFCSELSEPLRVYTRYQPKQYYNASVYNLLPQGQYSAGYISDDFVSQNILKWADSYANVYLNSIIAKVTRAEFVLLLVSLLNLKEEFTDNFPDVSKSAAYYEAVGTAKSLGILSDDTLFHPDYKATVGYANQILGKLSIPKTFAYDEDYTLSKQDLAKLILSLKDDSV